MLKLASVAINAKAELMELFAVLGLVLETHVDLIAKFFHAMCECTTITEFTRAEFPVPANFGLVLHSEVLVSWRPFRKFSQKRV
jgi:hypothetical protein